MTDAIKTPLAKTQNPRRWRDRLMVVTLIAGGLLTLWWILVLIGVAWQIVSAVASTGGHG